MDHSARAKLEQLGLPGSEAGIYLLLLKSGPLAASAIAAAAQIPRTSVYPALSALADKGLVEGGMEHGSRFAAVAPETALPGLIAREEELLKRRVSLARELGETLSAAHETSSMGPEEFVQVLRNPGAIVEHYFRLELEAERSIDHFVKPPFFTRNENPAQAKAMRRGVRVRALYERPALEDAVAVKPFLARWVAAGEEVRVFEGALPHKMVIFDSRVVLMPMVMPGDQTRTLIVRNPALAETFTLAFERLWERSQPFLSLLGKREAQPTAPQPAPKRRRAGAR